MAKKANVNGPGAKCLCAEKPCGPYIRVAGRVEVNLSALTGSGATGNYNSIATAHVYCCGKIREVPVLTGNTLKHWHAYYTAQAYKSMGGSCMNELCEKGIGLRGYRLGSKASPGNRIWAGSELEAIQDLCNDLHGFLQAEQSGGQPKGKSMRRDSLVRVAFAVPVFEDNIIDAIAAAKKPVTHNRVDPWASASQTEMMVFKSEYASAPYGISLSMDLAYILHPLYGSCSDSCGVPCSANLSEERLRRAKASVAALLPLLMGSGSKQARALPIAKPLELVVAISNIPIPNIVHGAYPDYVKKSIDILRAYLAAINSSGKRAEIKLLCMSQAKDLCSGGNEDEGRSGGNEDEGLSIEAVNSLSELVNKIKEEVRVSLDVCR